MKTIKLPVHGIVVELGDIDPEKPDAYLGGSITSDLVNETDEGSKRFDAGIDAMESMILSCACAGIDIETPAFFEAIETTVDKLADEYGV
jgi:hypothetical protein